MSSRTPFSINLEEDYDIYGIDPNENLDDWSFLEAKPEPIPEKDEEEIRLFNQLLAPSIPEEEIQAEIHDRLKSLLEETSKFIENDVKVELSGPIEIPKEVIDENINRESFEHKQAERVSAIVKDILHKTQESENIDELIKSLTKSDKIAENILLDDGDKSDIEQTDQSQKQTKKKKISKKTFAKSSPSTVSASDEPERKADEKEKGKETEQPKQIPAPEKKAEPTFLGRYKRKPGDVKTILRDHDETERLSSKFILEKKKREEDDRADLEKRMKDREEKQKLFFESLETEAEKHRREVQMIKEIKETKGPSLSEMINQIRPQEQSKPEINIQQKSKQKVADKPARYSTKQIEEFVAKREKKLELVTKEAAKVLIVDLETKKIKEENVTVHYSTTYQKNILPLLAEKLKPLLDEKRKEKERQTTLEKLGEKIKTNKIKLIYKKWRRRRAVVHVFRMVISAVRIQSAYRRFMKKKKEIQQKKEKQNKQKKITDEQLLDKARQMVAKQVPESTKLPQPEPPKQSYQQKKPREAVNFNFPVLNEPDMSWISNFEEKLKNNSIDFFDDDILDELPNKQILRLDESSQQKAKAKQFFAESESVPFDAETYGFLAQFGQKIDLVDDLEDDIDLSTFGIKKNISGVDEQTTSPEDNDTSRSKRQELMQPQSQSVQKQQHQQQQQQQEPQSPNSNHDENQGNGSRGPTEAGFSGYNFKNKETSKMMQKMINKKIKTSDPFKNEKPVEKFNRLYGNPNSGGGGGGAGRQMGNVQPAQIKRSEFKTNDTRTKRLKKLKSVWLNPPEQNAEAQPPPS